jgi:hypothetical protein
VDHPVAGVDGAAIGEAGGVQDAGQKAIAAGVAR